jgi:DNA polymerase-1
MPTPLFEPGASDVLYLIDFSGYVFRAYHAIAPLNSPSGEPTQAVMGTVNMLEKLVRTRRPALLAVAMDSTTPTFRKEIYPEYKAHRPPAPPDLSSQMKRSREIVEAFAIPCFQQDGFEADDLIAAAVCQARERKMRVVIVSADKDLMQLVGDDVVMWDTMRDKVFGPPEVQERFGVPIGQVKDWLALTGDASDNIPGVPSVGPKTATELLTRFGTLDGIFLNLDTIERKALREKLRENEDAARVSLSLVTLRTDVPVSFDPAKLAYGGRHVADLRRLYAELGFTRQLGMLETEPEQGTLNFTGDRQPVVAASAPSAPEKTTARTVSSRAELDALAAELSAAKYFSVLVETTIPNPVRGALVGLAFSASAGSAAYVPLAHRYMGAPAQLDRETVLSVLGPVLANENVAKGSHDVKRTLVVLRGAGFVPRGFTFDSMLAGYLLDPETPHDLPDLAASELAMAVATAPSLVPKVKGRETTFDEASVEDATTLVGTRADAVLRLRERLTTKLVDEGLAKVMDEIELPLSVMLTEMERNGVLVDHERLRVLGKRIEKELETLELESHRIAGRVFNVNSPRQLETLLFDELKLKPLRRTKTSRSTDADTLEALADDHPLPKVVLEHRQLSKLKGTYIDALPTLVNRESGRIHTSWDQAVAATGRLSSSDPNLQNIPIRSEVGREIRSAFVAPEGQALVSADYSQIELRVLAHLSGDAVLVDAFRSGQDVHTRTAIEVFGVAETGVTAEMRRRAKAVNFGVIYGQGESGLAKSLGIPRMEAASFIAAYFRRYEGVRRFMNEVLEAARAAGSIRTLFGRRRIVPDIRNENRARRLAAERIAMNTPIQGTAADLMKLAMLAFQKPPTPGSRMVLTVHDELVFEVPVPEIEQAMAVIKRAMEGVHALEVPLVVDVGHGKDWSHAH